MRKLTKKERFSEKVLSKFNIYNSIFSTLPYESISDTGQLLPLFNEVCNNGYKQKKDPKYIVCLLYTSPSPRDLSTSRMPSSA